MYCVHITGPAWTLLLRMYLHSALAQDEMSARRRPCALLGPTVYTTARLLVQVRIGTTSPNPAIGAETGSASALAETEKAMESEALLCTITSTQLHNSQICASATATCRLQMVHVADSTLL